MRAPPQSKEELVKAHALAALEHLSEEDKQKVLEYIKNLILLEKTTNDQTNLT